MNTLVKICGLTDKAAIDAAAASGADLGGFVFFDRSPRFLSYELAEELAAQTPPSLGRVALTVDPTDDELAAIKHAIDPAYIQLHGMEPVKRLHEIAARFEVMTIKALPIGSAKDVAAARVYDGQADLLLFDAKPRTSSRPGGWGEVFDWQLLAGETWQTPWLLAGGLTPANVKEAVELTRAPGVDVSTGVEVELGRKSPRLIEEFVRAAKGGA